ncbi:MAG: hypothetical protein NT094_02420 [Candidatus Staskawiczbacteria bacterium]|nr:hypothetical protein [Candidatus Staskawiczbacteria bacterium]
MALPEYLFWWDWVKKIIWDPFWWLILFLVILWVPFLRVWWWIFLPLMLQVQLKTLYLWWIGWDFDYATKQKWVFLEVIPLEAMLMPLKVMEDVFSAIWPIMDGANFREIWCDGELPNGPYWCSWEIASIEGKIHFYVRCLQQHRMSIESSLYGHYPDIEIHEAVDYVKLVPPTVPNDEWDMYGEDWDTFREDAYPIKTYPSFFEPQGERIAAEEKRMDPIISLLEAMSKLGPGEHYWVQFTTVPVGERDESEWKKEGQKIINKIAKRPEKKITTLMDDLSYVFKQIVMGPEKEGSGESAKYSWVPMEEDEETGELKISLTPGEREIITEVENKIKKPVFRTNIRGVYVAKRENWKAPHRVITRTYMGHFITANLNEFRFQGSTRPRVHFFMRQRRVFLRARKMFRMAVLRFPPLYPNRHDLCPILSTEEIATLYHFPLRVSGGSLAMVKIESKKAGPPANLPIDDE